MDRLLRLTALAVSGATLLWLSGCVEPSEMPPEEESSSIAAEIQQRKSETQAAKAAAAQAAADTEAKRLANEAPSEVTNDDFHKGSKITSDGYLGTVVRSGRRAGERVRLQNLEYNLKIHAAANGWPKSHEAFLELVAEWGLPLPELQGPYEYWYNAEDHKIYKRPIVLSDTDSDAAE